MKNYKVLILEDDLETVGKLMIGLHEIENESPVAFDVTSLSTYKVVEELINPQEASAYDIILLDRDCKLGGSFQTLDMERFGVDKIISISSTPEWNRLAVSRGVTRVVLKEFDDLDRFASKVMLEIKDILNGSRSSK